MSATVDYPVSLAIEDFAPVLLTTIGVVLLRRTVPDRGAVLVAAALIGCGGAAKATAKLLAATGHGDYPWLRGALFPLLTLGFGLLCLVLTRAAGPIPRWLLVLVPGLIVTCAAGAVLAGDPIVFLVSTTVFATLAGIRLIDTARRRGDTLAASLFGIQLLVFFILGSLASRPDQTVALQWAEQLSNTVAQAAFAYAAWRLGSSQATDTTQETR
ncbi:hypothetical protein [Nocardia alba]|uniref:YhhN-like protein n=1 Tax=Nocardia alba TaxID=225051 RepID=A0A4R1FQG3_9NOCA|nr:hypothetical protein [Nocardia alba]TCJ97127.1 hypothetical protein DFR71_3163 [Nocardia alba]